MGRLFREVRDSIIVANARTERIVLWNQSAERMFGYTEREALEMPLHVLVPESLRDRHHSGISRYQATGTGNLIDGASAVELKGLHKSGHEVPIELTLSKIPTPGDVGDRFVLAIIRDISERKAAEQANLKVREAVADRRRALELNDTIVQGLAVAKLAFESGDHEMGLQSVTKTLTHAQRLVGRLLGQIESTEGPLKPGDLVREETLQDD